MRPALTPLDPTRARGQAHLREAAAFAGADPCDAPRDMAPQLGDILYRAELPNGKLIMAHLSKPLTEAKAEFEPGTMVVLELTAFDFDSGRILGPVE